MRLRLGSSEIEIMDKLDIINNKDVELQKRIDAISWKEFLRFGSVKIQIRDGRAVLVTIERTVKLD